MFVQLCFISPINSHLYVDAVTIAAYFFLILQSAVDFRASQRFREHETQADLISSSNSLMLPDSSSTES